MAEYLPALWVHWVALMGMSSLLIGLGLRIGRRVSRTFKGWSEIPGWMLICAGLVGVFWAGYAAWQEKNQALIALEQKLKTPEFGGELSTVMTGSRGRGKSLVVVAGAITNPLGPPSGAVGWNMGIQLPDSRIIWGEAPPTGGKDITVHVEHNGLTVTLPIENYWPTKTLQPIPAGGAADGWFWSTFGNLDLDEAYVKRATVIVEFKDVIANKTHSLTIDLAEKGIHVPG